MSKVSFFIYDISKTVGAQKPSRKHEFMLLPVSGNLQHLKEDSAAFNPGFIWLHILVTV